MSKLPRRHVRKGITTVECWFYVRVFSGVPGANTTTDVQSPCLAHGDLKFGITVSVPQREALYRGDGGVMAFCMWVSTRSLARGIEALLVDEFKRARSAALGYRPEYLDIKLVASALGAPSQAEGDGASTRLVVAQAFIDRAYSLLKLVRPGDQHEESVPASLAALDFDNLGVVVRVDSLPRCKKSREPESARSDSSEADGAVHTRKHVAYSDLVPELLQAGPEQDAARVAAERGEASLEHVDTLAMADTVTVWDMEYPRKADEAFYRNHVVGGNAVWMRLHAWSLHLDGANSGSIRTEMSRVSSKWKDKRRRRRLETLMHASELIEALFTEQQADALKSPLLAKTQVCAKSLTVAVNSVRDRYTAEELDEMSAMLFQKKGERGVFKWFAKAMKTAFHLDVRRVECRKGRVGYDRVIVTSAAVWELVAKYRPLCLCTHIGRVD